MGSLRLFIGVRLSGSEISPVHLHGITFQYQPRRQSESGLRKEIEPALIEALAYPRAVVRSNMELANCPHNDLYDGEDGKCAACPQ